MGDMVSGVLGDPDVRLDFTILGGALQEANELESASKMGRATRIICNSDVRGHADPDMTFLTLSRSEGRDPVWEMQHSGVSGLPSFLPSPKPHSQTQGAGRGVETPPFPPEFSVAEGGQKADEGEVKERFQASVHSLAEAFFSTRFGWPVLLFSLWLLPVAFFHMASASYTSGIAENERNRVQKLLDEDVLILEKVAEPDMVFSLYTLEKTRRIQENISQSEDPESFVEKKLPGGLNKTMSSSFPMR